MERNSVRLPEAMDSAAADPDTAAGGTVRYVLLILSMFAAPYRNDDSYRTYVISTIGASTFPTDNIVLREAAYIYLRSVNKEAS